MALLPEIPERPADRPESWGEYRRRRAMIALHRGLSDDLCRLFRRELQLYWPTDFGVSELLTARRASAKALVFEMKPAR